MKILPRPPQSRKLALKLSLIKLQRRMPHDSATNSPPGGLPSFLRTLSLEGRAIVALGEEAAESNEATSAELLRLDQLARETLALDAPPFSAEVARWAAKLFYRLCQFSAYRDIGPEQIAAAIAQPAPENASPSAAWSADLTLRHLPKLHFYARHLSDGDPLLHAIEKVAAEWPLSSVGLPDLELSTNQHDWIDHPTLLRLYVDRITQTKDTSRLGDPRVVRKLKMDLGIHHDLAPELAAALSTPFS